jgi:hypothetical protein
MAFEDDKAALEDQIAALEDRLADAGALVAAFDGELREMEKSLAKTSSSVRYLSGSVGRGLKRAIDDLVLDGAKLSDVLKGAAENVLDATYRAALKPVTKQLGGIVAAGLGGIGAVAPFADGAAFSQGRVTPFAKGGVVTRATTFPMRGGTGQMGEAGPEAILPLERGADGRLGVSGGGARPVNVVINVSTPDVAGFQRSQGQIAARLGRVLAQGARQR